MIYTVMPPELVWEGFGVQEEELKRVELQEKAVWVRQLSFNQAKVIRLESSDPKDYLNPNFQPGAILDFNL